MKREVVIFISNIIILFAACGCIINFSPYISNQIISAVEFMDKLSNPYTNSKVVFAKISPFISTKSDNNTNTTQEDDRQVMNSINSKDGFDNEDLLKTPADVQALMDEEEQVIDGQEEAGKTSEENYSGGGTIISFGNVQVQSKIPESFYDLNIENILNEGANLTVKDPSKPTVLIYHSHTTESYTLLDVGYYTKSADLKTKSTEKIWCGSGTKFAAYLRNVA